MTRKLSETLNMDEIPEELRDEIFEITIPEDADLDDVTRLALDAYKMQMESIINIEPKYRARALEVAKQYLDLAMTSMSKKKELDQKERKLNKDLGGTDKKPSDEEQTVSRQQILKELAASKKRA